MSIPLGALALAGAVLAATLGAEPEKAAGPKVGERAPEFTLAASDGKEYTLKQFAGKTAVVIAWYPKAMTGG